MHVNMWMLETFGRYAVGVRSLCLLKTCLYLSTLCMDHVASYLTLDTCAIGVSYRAVSISDIQLWNSSPSPVLA